MATKSENAGVTISETPERVEQLSPERKKAFISLRRKARARGQELGLLPDLQTMVFVSGDRIVTKLLISNIV